jgi:alpha-1,3-rhamnosyl/mannosyltransferase
MLEAYALLPAAVRERFPLVIAGARGWRSSDLVNRLRRVGDRQVRFLSQVDRSVLSDLYAGAALFAFPSLYEGFGLPPLEAMASGAPVIVSDRASLPEVVGDAGETMDPMDPEQTAQKVWALLENADARLELSRRGLQRANRFTWASCAKVTHAVYRSALAAAGNSV